MRRALSPQMRETLRVAVEQGALVRWPGGWWTYPSCAVKHTQASIIYRNLDVPAWSVGVGTVLALVKRGYLTVTQRDPDSRRELRVEPTEQARSLP